MTPLRIYKQTFIIFLHLLCIRSAFAQTSLFGRERYISAKNDTLNYRILTPDFDTMRRYPLVIFLHGSGERGSDNESQLKWGVMNFATNDNMKLHPAIVIAPQCPVGQTWSNFSNNADRTDMKLLPAPSKPMQLVLDLIKEVTKKFLVDTNRIYITGLSMVVTALMMCWKDTRRCLLQQFLFAVAEMFRERLRSRKCLYGYSMAPKTLQCHRYCRIRW